MVISRIKYLVGDDKVDEYAATIDPDWYKPVEPPQFQKDIYNLTEANAETEFNSSEDISNLIQLCKICAENKCSLALNIGPPKFRAAKKNLANIGISYSSGSLGYHNGLSPMQYYFESTGGQDGALELKGSLLQDLTNFKQFDLSTIGALENRIDELEKKLLELKCS